MTTQSPMPAGVGGLERAPRLPKSASSSALMSLGRRGDRRDSNPTPMIGDWHRRGPPPSPSSSSNATTSGGRSRRPSAPSTPDSGYGPKPPKPHRGLSVCQYVLICGTVRRQCGGYMNRLYVSWTARQRSRQTRRRHAKCTPTTLFNPLTPTVAILCHTGICRHL